MFGLDEFGCIRVNFRVVIFKFHFWRHIFFIFQLGFPLCWWNSFLYPLIFYQWQLFGCHQLFHWLVFCMNSTRSLLLLVFLFLPYSLIRYAKNLALSFGWVLISVWNFEALLKRSPSTTGKKLSFEFFISSVIISTSCSICLRILFSLYFWVWNYF
jgi:hypothetical protein